MNSRLSPRPRLRLRSQRGSVLMVALILAAAMAVALTSYMGLTTNSAKMANRSFYMDGAQNLCDLGIEQALWCMNNDVWTGSANFALRSGTTNEYQGTFPTSSTFFELSAGVKGRAKIWADMSNSSRPHVVVQSTVTLPGGGEIVKMAEAYMRRRSYFEDGLVGDTLDISGRVDSWNSDPDADGLSPVAYSSGVAAANARVAATSTVIKANDVGQGIIAGYAAAGSASGQNGITIGSQGIVGDTSYISNSANKGTIQTDHATYDFTADFPDATNPAIPSTSSTGATYTPITISDADTTLPGATDPRASDGKYYYYINQISLTGNSDSLVISNNREVVIIVTSTGNNAVSVSGTAPGIVIGTNSRLQMYCAGDVSISGNGVTNGTASHTGSGPSSTSGVGQPIAFQLYGTRSAATAASSGAQSISIGGNGYLSGVIYAPNADVHINGNGDVYGAVIGQTVTFSGSNVRFHIDESLQDTLSTGLWMVRKWRELSTVSERAEYADELAF